MIIVKKKSRAQESVWDMRPLAPKPPLMHIPRNIQGPIESNPYPDQKEAGKEKKHTKPFPVIDHISVKICKAVSLSKSFSLSLIGSFTLSTVSISLEPLHLVES